MVVRTSFVGRKSELAAIERALAEARVVTLHGPPGVGKSRLLREFTRDVVDLVGVRDAAALRARIARHFGTTDALEAIASSIEDRDVVLALDPFEHLVPAAHVLAELVDAAPSLRVLLASRERTRIEGETIVPVEPLPIDDALALFLARAGAVAPQRQLAVDDARRLVERLDRLPLAIELAAARTPMLTPRELLDRVHERPLRAAIDVSYALLEVDERRAWTACAVFRGGFTLQAAEAVLGPQASALLDRLIAHALVIASDEGGTTRYQLLETLRREALERLEDCAAYRRHARYYAFHPSPRERENLLAALDHAEGDDKVRIVVALDPILIAEGPVDLHREVLASVDAEAPALLRARGRYVGVRGRHREAAALHTRARDLYREAGDEDGVRASEAMIAFTLRALGDSAALEHARRAMGSSDPTTSAHAEMMLGLAESAFGDPAAAYDRLRHAAALARGANASRLAGLALANAASVARKLGRHTDARASIDESRAMLEVAGDRLHLAKLAGIEGGLLRVVGRFDEAEETLARAINELSLFSDPQGEAEARLELAALAIERGDRRLAERALEDAGALLTRVELAELATFAATLRARLREATAAPRVLRVDPDGRAFVYGDRRVELARRAVTRRVLLAFVRQRIERPGVAMSVHEVFSAGWPGERVVGTSGHARVYMTVRGLRALGLEGALLTRDDGYLLDPQLQVVTG